LFDFVRNDLYLTLNKIFHFWGGKGGAERELILIWRWFLPFLCFG
jgi:hypothetical protein